MERVRAEEAAVILGVSKRELLHLAATGELPGAARLARQWTFKVKKLERFALFRKERKLDEEIVYFVRCDERIKIGYTRNIGSRLAQFRTSNSKPVELLLTIPGGREEERIFHAQFARYRMQGEWFRYVPELRRAIRELEDLHF
jgi:hypothetical protein